MLYFVARFELHVILREIVAKGRKKMKGEKVAQLELLLHSHPEGMRKAEIARRIGVHRSTISRYIDDLKNYIEITDENNLIKLAEKPEMEPMELSVYEGLAFNLSAKMLALNTEMQNPHLVTGLRKIAMNMQSYAPTVSSNIMSLAEEIDKEITKQSGAAKYNSIMEVLIDSWVSGKIVKVQYKGNDFEEPEENEFAPYFIGFVESHDGRNPISVTGRLRHTTNIITLEIAKIISAEILDQTYTIPDNLKAFKKKEALDDIDSSDMIPLTLSMKEKSAFNAFTTLYMEQPKIEKQEDGSFICKMSVENSIELILRLVQCGSSVKILEPESFKKRFCNYLENIQTVYKD